MGSAQQSIFGFEVEQVERVGTGAPVSARSTSNRPKRLTKTTVVPSMEQVERPAETFLHARVSEGDGVVCAPARISDVVDTRSTCSTCSTDAKTLVGQGNEVERVEATEPVPPRSTEENSEILSLEVRYLADLPVPCTLTLDVRGVGEVLVSTSRTRVELERRAGRPVWAPLGFELAAYAVQEDRARPEDWQGWCARLRARGWRLDEREAFGGAAGVEDAWRAARRTGAPQEPRIALRRLLRLVGAHLVSCEVEGAPSAQESAEVAW
jgi:hypothetical protein